MIEQTFWPVDWLHQGVCDLIQSTIAGPESVPRSIDIYCTSTPAESQKP